MAFPALVRGKVPEFQFGFPKKEVSRMAASVGALWSTVFFDWESITVGIGILVGLAWSRRTGWSCGGVITPGLLALYGGDPRRTALTLALGALLAPPLSAAARTFGLYGKERIGAAMLLALLSRLLLEMLFPLKLHWVGWIIPGLIAADCDRQGMGMTLCSTISCALVTVFCMTLFRNAFTAF